MATKIARRKLAAHIAEQLKSGSDVKRLASQTVAYLAETKQTGQVELLIRDIEAEFAETYGAVTARITAARQLDGKTRAAIVEFVKAVEGAGSVVIADETTDPDLIGGVIVQTPNSTFDSSIRTKLRQLTATTKE